MHSIIDLHPTQAPQTTQDARTLALSYTFTAAIAVAETDFHNSETERQGKLTSDHAAGITRCTRCGTGTFTSLRLKPEPSTPGLQIRPKRACEPFCLTCAADLTTRWLAQYRTLRQLPDDARRARALRYLLRRCDRQEARWVAEHFEFCWCCLAPDALVGKAGECCAACEGAMMEGEKAAAKKGARRADKVSRRVERNGKCERCEAPTRHALWKCCRGCREILRGLPGLKCTKCKTQPRPEGFRRCKGCRSLDRKAAASRGRKVRA